nr:hypothetical protein CFP56_42121 [Quercus suber]
MARRSSARLRGRDSSTPKRVSLSHEVQSRTPRTVPTKLPSVQENEDMPGAFPASPTFQETRSGWTKTAVTPTNLAPIRPSSEEMHPQHHQQTTAKPMQEARHLGFADMGPHTAPPKHSSKIATLQGTPTRSTVKASTNLTSPDFKFTFQREHSLELSPDAKRLMVEKREEAARIRQQMIADGEGPRSVTETLERRMATPTGAKGRFSDAHSLQFQKMSSIANHPSSFRADPTRLKTFTLGAESSSATRTPRMLKRSPSKAELDVAEDSTHFLPRSSTKARLSRPAPQTFHAPSTGARESSADGDSSSPAKRVKRAMAEDTSSRRMASSIVKSPPATPRTNARGFASPTYPDLSKLAATLPEASLSRANSIKANKTSKIPAPQSSAVKPSISRATKDDAKDVGPLLARSPSKGSIFAKRTNEKSDVVDEPTSPFLSRSPSKLSLFGKSAKSEDAREQAVAKEPLLLRSPSRLSVSKKPKDLELADTAQAKSSPFLSRSPMKMTVNKEASQTIREVEEPAHAPLLLRSPAKITMSEAITAPTGSQGADSKPPPIGNLMSRFSTLRSSPVKSILRTPQRLYSNDPAKVAAGTHMTPPRPLALGNKFGQEKVPATAPVSKRVDFSSSTKACDDAVKRTPTRTLGLPVKFDTQVKAAPIANYPELPMMGDDGSPSPQKRRQTATPTDFTFRAGEHRIIFSRSPSAPADAAQTKRPSTIRHVSADVHIVPPQATGSKKRKFEFENESSVADGVAHAIDNKENLIQANEGEARPAKRSKITPVSPAPPPARKAVTAQKKTPGVKPRGAKAPVSKRPNTISQARLSALSQPKRRV